MNQEEHKSSDISCALTRFISHQSLKKNPAKIIPEITTPILHFGMLKNNYQNS